MLLIFFLIGLLIPWAFFVMSNPDAFEVKKYCKQHKWTYFEEDGEDSNKTRRLYCAVCNKFPGEGG